MKKLIFLILTILVIFIAACDTETDDQSPVISNIGSDAFPKNCDTIYTGQSFSFIAEFTDNAELGAYSLDIHNNFNHHSHSTDPSDCVLDVVKNPLNPWIYIQQFSIPSGSISYKTNDQIQVPADIEPGDYHLYIKLTDKSGWQTIKGISIKVLNP
jgi:hypothetical protein